jgi:cell division GTPase FtsZ
VRELKIIGMGSTRCNFINGLISENRYGNNNTVAVETNTNVRYSFAETKILIGKGIKPSDFVLGRSSVI